jgi:heme A synthase
MMGKNNKQNERSLKDQNNASLVTILIANIAIFAVALKTDQLLAADYQEILKQWQALIPAGVGAVLIGVINGLLNTQAKARLVFWRWHDPLPGSRAFSEYVHLDPRIDVAALKLKVGPFATKPNEQNALWYKLYKSVENDPRVLHVHRLFLLTRDYAGIAFMLLIVFGGIGIVEMQTYKTELLYAAALLAQFVASAVAARNYGVRFVNTVLALKAAE